MKKVALWSVLLTLVLGSTLLAFGLARSAVARTDCPGTVVCPITGEEICKDRCPLTDANRSDCPGQIICPLTGEPVCSDQCPLTQPDDRTVAAPSCCRVRQ